MAKKKGKKGKGKSKSKMGIDTSKLIGMAGGVFAESKFLSDFLGKYITDPKMKAVALIAIGEYAPKQDFVKNFMKDEAILRGGGDALTVMGIKNLLAEMGIAGIGAPTDTDELAVVIEGVESSDMDEDVLGDDDDLNVVNEDILGDDDLNVVNEDILGDDDDDMG
jgi:hypothetical protein